MLKMYDELASWWPVLSPPENYAEEARFYKGIFRDSGLPASPTLLELGSGGGNNALYLKTLFVQMTLVDLSPHMLAVSRALNPECEHIKGDMRNIRLGRTFDAVFIHDAIDYMTTLEDLAQAMETACIHCKQGAVVQFVPDHVRETFEPSTDHGGVDVGDRGLRYLEWSHAPAKGGYSYIVDYTYVLRENEEIVGVEHDQHTFGIFPRDNWLQLLDDVGFETEILTDDFDREIFVATKR